MKITRYILLFTIFFSFNLYGGSEKLVEKFNYAISYEEALKKAEKSNKPILMVVGQEGCPWCRKFEIKTLTNKTIHKKVQENFIPLSVLRYKDKDKFPKKFQTKGVPTVLFIEPKQQNVFYKSFGYKSKAEYKIELNKAVEIFNNKYKI
ncbi:thioredoxin family protein [Arcobacteraceae bacterium]|nr:thioredoxin family protein [Arcobacteraceae bacterium]